MWEKILNTLDYTSHNGRYLAVFQYAHNGHNTYYCFDVREPNRTLIDAVGIGSLPTISHMLPIEYQKPIVIKRFDNEGIKFNSGLLASFWHWFVVNWVRWG
jgi:hypothetical protein